MTIIARQHHLCREHHGRVMGLSPHWLFIVGTPAMSDPEALLLDIISQIQEQLRQSVLHDMQYSAAAAHMFDTVRDVDPIKWLFDHCSVMSLRLTAVTSFVMCLPVHMQSAMALAFTTTQQSDIPLCYRNALFSAPQVVALEHAVQLEGTAPQQVTTHLVATLVQLRSLSIDWQTFKAMYLQDTEMFMAPNIHYGTMVIAWHGLHSSVANIGGQLHSAWEKLLHTCYMQAH
jgi:hypothetical protein